ncbi:hypothetical protein A2U01_0057195, partial [Trifolium medium]|nr:hypothetical protein [Trifolium medium]
SDRRGGDPVGTAADGGFSATHGGPLAVGTTVDRGAPAAGRHRPPPFPI